MLPILSEYLGIFFNGIIVWSFLMALFFSVLMFFLGQKDKSIILTSLIMFISYYISGEWHWLIDDKSDVYLLWIAFDYITILFISLSHKLAKLKSNSAVKYIYFCLFINSMLFLGMHVDVIVNENTEPWWYWNLYSYGMILIDFSMAASLVIFRDFTGISKIFDKFHLDIVLKKKSKTSLKKTEKRLSQAMLQA
ncbi:hypothetical protein [Pseudoalteromonas sp. G4]|uniref:hypothetical protein n=1 Tax=Pseudoalteromonas sp. G4 TaxID=2992761 RepID=UPI00237D6B41|nr:hypothetical protein [Pseudoalteromonas sp. G4]MDE3272972.1 hypothetical protein [Pseudoalteromonas sp. G4]